MVGEMRDKETASIAIEASLTGHLVLSTLHTNSAPETIVRLLEMGIEPFNFADSLLGILAQRLTRTLCTGCKQPYHPKESEFLEICNLYGRESFEELGITYDDGFELYRPIGCKRCSNTGYKGRIALHELLIGSDEVKDQIVRRVRIDNIRQTAMSQGMSTLMQDGVRKVLKGYTDFKSVRSVCIK
jgi:type II secretory ATPase GspE/PulE/Tfp pilus assembly ATPase PilB-like protein